MRRIKTIVTATMLAAAVGATATTSAEARPDPGPRQGPFGCAAKDFLGKGDRLRPGRALCTPDYLLRMQKNGDLVLREIATGRACWHSRTFVPGVSATFRPGRHGVVSGLATHPPVPPELRIGRRVIKGENIEQAGLVQDPRDGTTANLNDKGEFWVGYKVVGRC